VKLPNLQHVQHSSSRRAERRTSAIRPTSSITTKGISTRTICRYVGGLILAGSVVAACTYMPHAANQSRLIASAHAQNFRSGAVAISRTPKDDATLVETSDAQHSNEASTTAIDGDIGGDQSDQPSHVTAASPAHTRISSESEPLSSPSPDGNAAASIDVTEAMPATSESIALPDQASRELREATPTLSPQTKSTWTIASLLKRHGQWGLLLLVPILVIMLLRMMTHYATTRRKAALRHRRLMKKTRRTTTKRNATLNHQDKHIALATEANESATDQVSSSMLTPHSTLPPGESHFSLSWLYEQPNYAQSEYWSVDTPVDFTPEWTLHLLQPRADISPTVQPAPHPEITDATQATGDTRENSAASDPQGISIVEAESGHIPTPKLPALETPPAMLLPAVEVVEDLAPPSLLDQLEQMATAAGDGLPAFLIEHDGYLPTIASANQAPLPVSVLESLETVIRQAVGQHEHTATWLFVQILLMRIVQADRADIESLHAQALTLAQQGRASANALEKSHWQARLIDIDLAKVAQQKGATRLLGLRNMQARYAPDIQLGAGAVLQAWVGVLLFWAQCQRGDSALDKYTEAELVCQRLQDIPDHAGDAQRLLAKVLVHRAEVEQGGTRVKHLDTAQALLDELFAHTPTAKIAMAVATTALARGKALPPEQAKQTYSHALMHAFLAEGDPRWRADSLQCRLAIQLSYEALPEVPIQGHVALDLTSRLEALPTPPPETLHRMAQAYLRNAEFDRACQLCEQAWRNSAAAETLLTTWQEASKQWAASLPQPNNHAPWQESERKRRIASQRH